MPKISNANRSKLSKALAEYKDPTNPGVGLHLGIRFEDYCKIDAVNRSSLSRVKDSLLHYANAPPPDDSPALAFGSLCHHGRLEPEELVKRYIVLPDFHKDPRNVTGKGEPSESKVTKFYKDCLAQLKKDNPDKQEVSREWMDKMYGMIKAIDDHPKASKLFAKGIPEVTIVWKDTKTGLMCKCRLDWLAGPELGMSVSEIIAATTDLVDLKTTEDIVGFCLDKHDYHLQGAMYLAGWGAVTKKQHPFQFVAAEKPKPNAVRCAPIGKDAIDNGLLEFRWLLNRVAAAKKADKFPGPQDPASWGVSKWYKPLWFVEHVGEQ